MKMLTYSQSKIIFINLFNYIMYCYTACPGHCCRNRNQTKCDSLFAGWLGQTFFSMEVVAFSFFFFRWLGHNVIHIHILINNNLLLLLIIEENPDMRVLWFLWPLIPPQGHYGFLKRIKTSLNSLPSHTNSLSAPMPNMFLVHFHEKEATPLWPNYTLLLRIFFCGLF